MRTAHLYFLVIVSGASVLSLEILGTRILGPFYGVSLFLWSALITVTLAALSVGYAVGGRLADRSATLNRLGMIVAGAGAWTTVIPWMEHPVLGAVESWGLRAAVLTTALLLFGPPLTLLGMVSPYAIRLKASSLEHVGRTAGNLYAVSTVASVASALSMGFFLIPAVGVSKLTFGTGLLLMLAGAVAMIVGGLDRKRLAGVAVVVLALGSLGMTRLPERLADPDRGLLVVRQSAYAELRVADNGNVRHLLIDGGIHTIVDKDTGRSWHRYTVATELMGYLFEEPGSMLLVGLGGGAVAKYFAREGWSVTVVEIDSAVAEIAREYFGLKDSDCDVHVMDGRRFLSASEETYDLIVVDAFGSSSIPFHLATTEAFGLMKSRLAPGGVLAMNVETLGWHDRLVTSLAASLAPHFEHVTALPTIEPPDALGNVIMAAWDGEKGFDEFEKLPRPYDYLQQPHMHWWATQITHAWDNRFTPEVAGVEPFTDDRNPLDLWSEQVNLVARRDLHQYFQESGTSW